MGIDKSDFIAFLTEYGSTILTEGLKWTDLGLITANEAEAEILVALGNGIAILADHSGGGSHVYRTTDYGLTWSDLGAIMTMAATGGVYLGNGIALVRKCVDQLDQVTIWRVATDAHAARYLNY